MSLDLIWWNDVFLKRMVAFMSYIPLRNMSETLQMAFSKLSRGVLHKHNTHPYLIPDLLQGWNPVASWDIRIRNFTHGFILVRQFIACKKDNSFMFSTCVICLYQNDVSWLYLCDFLSNEWNVTDGFCIKSLNAIIIP